jgi:hypothetical protein
VEEKRVSITDNVQKVAISPQTAEQLQHDGKLATHTPKGKSATRKRRHNSKITNITQGDIWTEALRIAMNVATQIVDDKVNGKTVDQTAKMAAIRRTANRLIVRGADQALTVYNNTTQADIARKSRS